ncbi:MAG: MFS transporter [Planctomycetaceae bacterium]|nr:MFS transporter [Planctomycetaceae bacterium]
MSTLTRGITGKTSFTILVALSSFHMFNDTLQAMIAAIYPILHDTLSLDLGSIGMITLVYQVAASIFQPLVGWYADKRPQPYALPFGMGTTMTGLVILAYAANYGSVLFAVVLIGIGSAIFHPEASRLAYLASGGRFGFAQSLFQVGGNFGGTMGPLLAALFITQTGQKNLVWFTVIPVVAACMMLPVSQWYKRQLVVIREKRKSGAGGGKHPVLPTHMVVISLCVLLTLIFSKYVYWASLGSYYTFYLIKKFDVSIAQAQYCLALFGFSVAAGTMIGGHIGDRIGRKYVIWVSILGVAPFTMLLPYVNSLWLTCVLSVVIGLILSSAFSAILIYAQELLPGKVGMIAGLFFGFAFGIAGIASAVLGYIADRYGIVFVYQICSYLPLLGIVAVFLPNMHKIKARLSQPPES